MMARLIKTDGTETFIAPENEVDFKLDELQMVVGDPTKRSLIVPVRLPKNRLMVCDEEGLLKELPLNAAASHLAGNIIVGDVVVCEDREFQ